MPVEIEAKMKVPDHAPIRKSLIDHGAKSKGLTLESNSFFDTDDRALLAKDHGLRLRHARDMQSDAEQTIITFKGARQLGKLKSREERELIVGNVKDATALLEMLGFHRVLMFQKKRESWDLKGCHVELDEVPYLGTYVEIEGPSETAVLELRTLLRLDAYPPIKASYIAMLMTHLQERGINDRVVVFK
jgi:adenylate cyclase class 2